MAVLASSAMKKYEIRDYLTMAGFCLVLFVIPYVGKFLMQHAQATLTVIFAVSVFWFVTRR